MNVYFVLKFLVLTLDKHTTSNPNVGGKISAIWLQKSVFSTYDSNLAYYVGEPLIGCCYCFLFICLFFCIFDFA